MLRWVPASSFTVAFCNVKNAKQWWNYKVFCTKITEQNKPHDTIQIQDGTVYIGVECDV